MKAVLGEKLIALSSSKMKLERAYSSNLTAQLKSLEQKDADTLNRSQHQEIITFREKIDRIEKKKNHSKNQQNQELVL